MTGSVSFIKPQTGASLIMGLLMLLVMTLLGLTATNSNLLQARTQANQMEQALARSAAVQGLLWVEGWLAAASATTIDGNCANRCGAPAEISSGSSQNWSTATLAGIDPISGATVRSWPGHLPETRYYLSRIHSETVVSSSGAETIHFYRVRAASRLHDSWIMVESIVARTPSMAGPCTPELARGFGLDSEQGTVVPLNDGLPRCGRQAFRIPG